MFEKILQHLRGARKIELFVLIAIVAMVVLMYVSRSSDNYKGTEIETRLEMALEAVEGVGKVKVVINEVNEEGITGVLVVAQGVDKLNTYMKVQSAVKTLLDVDISCIEIIEMGE